MIELSPHKHRSRHPSGSPGWVRGRKCRKGYRVDVVWREWAGQFAPDTKVVVGVDGGEWTVQPSAKGYKVHRYGDGIGLYLRIMVGEETARELGVCDTGFDFVGVSYVNGGLRFVTKQEG